MKSFRSALYIPASNERALAKAPSLAADALIVDLEDAVSTENKVSARSMACDALGSAEFAGRFCVLRINGSDTVWGEADLEAGIKANPDAILVPKVESASSVKTLSESLEKTDACSSRLWVMIETPLGFLNIQSICEAALSTRLDVLVIGVNDLAKDTGIQPTADRTGMLFALSQSVLAAKAYGLTLFDGVYNNFKDLDGFELECRHGKMLGMDGKSLVHPSQIEACNRIFGPTDEEVDWARKVVAVFDLEENANANVVSIEGEMVERLHAEMAVNLLSKLDG